MGVVRLLRSLGFGQYENMFRDDAVIKRGRKIMRSYMWAAVLLAATLLVTGDAKAQQQPAAGGNPLDVVPEKMPFNTPYGTPISLEKAQTAVQAAVAEANKRGWPLLTLDKLSNSCHITAAGFRRQGC